MVFVAVEVVVDVTEDVVVVAIAVVELVFVVGVVHMHHHWALNSPQAKELAPFVLYNSV